MRSQEAEVAVLPRFDRPFLHWPGRDGGPKSLNSKRKRSRPSARKESSNKDAAQAVVSVVDYGATLL